MVTMLRQACQLVCKSETPTALKCKVLFAGQQFSRHCASSGTKGHLQEIIARLKWQL
jgi:hypothetical protein